MNKYNMLYIHIKECIIHAFTGAVQTMKEFLYNAGTYNTPPPPPRRHTWCDKIKFLRCCSHRCLVCMYVQYVCLYVYFFICFVHAPPVFHNNSRGTAPHHITRHTQIIYILNMYKTVFFFWFGLNWKLLATLCVIRFFTLTKIKQQLYFVYVMNNILIK